MPKLSHRFYAGTSSTTRQRGLATLVMVMMLFFIIAMVAAYTSRNMIFEQRASANLYRSTQAFEAAEAGLQWTLAMLNAGRIDDYCNPTADQTKTTFRARYIDTVDTSGAMTLRFPHGETMPFCVMDAALNTWSCRCPSDGPASLPSGWDSSTGSKPMFRIQFKDLPAPATRRDSIQVVSAGCTRPDASCLVADTPVAPSGDALAVVSAVVTSRSGLSGQPAAAVTARADINGGSGPLRGINTDLASGGLTFLAGGGIAGNVQPVTFPPGMPGSASLAEGHPTLSGMVPAGPVATVADRMFSLVFGVAPDVYMQQPAVLSVDCTVACTSAAIDALAKQYPGRILWLRGNLTVNGDIGSPLVAGTLRAAEVPPTGPVLLVVAGQITLTSGTVYGLLYSRSATWDRGAGSAQVQGAIIAEGSLTGSGSQSVTYDADILTRLRTRRGSFVRVNGGWKDF
jgi:hypothetical protein